ncbi:MAG: (2Fe-2S)-binding protein [Acetobacteraceae bacterium]|nr:(2Fe-2S)-binding protein [Acetobacteraceae bacterium]
MFHRPPDPTRREAETVTVTLDGRPVRARTGDTVAAVALLAGLDHTRTNPATGERRAPYCMMGTCFECLMVIDGEPSRQACLVTVREGMVIERQHGAPRLR